MKANAAQTKSYMTEMHSIATNASTTVMFDEAGNRQKSNRKKSSSVDGDGKVYGDEYYDESDEDLDLSKIHKMHKSLEYDENAVDHGFQE